jgi:hypothetical protein
MTCCFWPLGRPFYKVAFPCARTHEEVMFDAGVMMAREKFAREYIEPHQIKGRVFVCKVCKIVCAIILIVLVILLIVPIILTVL